jgi:hypothetical protein
MKILISIAIVLALMIPLTALAQMADEAEVKEVTAKYDLGLTKSPSLPFLDLSRLDISHAYSISYFSGSGYSGTQGFYSGSMQYQLAKPLTLTLNLGILHDPGAFVGHKSFSENSAFFPSGWLDWRPSENFRLSIGFQSVPAYRNGGHYYNNPGSLSYWRNR